MQHDPNRKNINHRGGDDPLGAFLAAFAAEYYQVMAIHAQEKNRVAVNERHLPAWEVPRLAARLHQLNREGFHIFARPVGHEYVLLDDLRRAGLGEVARAKPCALVETSPGNYQAWLTLPQAPGGPGRAGQVYRWLAGQYGADLASAKPGQVGRLPGFLNVKQKHFHAGAFPLVELHRAQRRLAVVALPESFPDSPPCGLSFGGSEAKPGGDRSAYDFQFACTLIEQGKKDEEVLEILQRFSRKAQSRADGARYLAQTIANARRKVGMRY